METLMEKLEFRKDDRQGNIRVSVDQLKEIPGILQVIRKGVTLQITYDPYKISDTNITISMEEMGYQPLKEQKMGFFSRWLERLANSNRKAFGDKKPDCCNLNSNK